MTKTYIILYLVYYQNLGPSWAVVLDYDEKPREFKTHDLAYFYLNKNREDLMDNTHHVIIESYKTDEA